VKVVDSRQRVALNNSIVVVQVKQPVGQGQGREVKVQGHQPAASGQQHQLNAKQVT